MADFREELTVSRSKDQFGRDLFLPRYSWCLSQTDLADNTVKVIDFGDNDDIGKICQLISDFEPTEQDVKLGIKAFLETDSYNSTEEY